MQTLLQQEHASYTMADRQVWSILYTRQLKAIEKYVYPYFARGLHQLGFSAESVPEFSVINQRLELLTGWKVYAVPGLIPNRSFFKLMAFKRFGATTWLRKMEQLDYLEEPDMFHDVFGHIPLLADPLIADFLVGLARIAERFIDQEEVIEWIARLYWYTIEFGLVQEGREAKIYGAGILSSIGETAFSLSAGACRLPFDLEQVLDTPYIKDKFQEQYFVLDSLEQLPDILAALDQRLRAVYTV
jgi:phenylalanine-4-hydroxylase